MPEPRPPDLAGVAAGFANLLHAAGVSVAPDRAGRWATAVQLARPATTNELYWLGRVTLTLDRNEIAVYDAVFASVFRGLTDVADSRGDPNAAPIPRLDTAPDRARDGTRPVDGATEVVAAVAATGARRCRDLHRRDDSSQVLELLRRAVGEIAAAEQFVWCRRGRLRGRSRGGVVIQRIAGPT